jgi:opacity protein-like surface antigen
MKSLFVAAALAALGVASSAAAQPDLYGNLGYSYVDSHGVSLSALGGRAGWRVNPYFGVEAEAAFGLDDDTARVSGAPVKVKLQDSVAGYAVGFYPVSPKLDLFARVGYGTARIKASVAGYSARGDNDGWNAGVGAQYFVTDKDGVRAEFTKVGFDDKGLDANTWSVSYVRKF